MGKKMSPLPSMPFDDVALALEAAEAAQAQSGVALLALSEAVAALIGPLRQHHVLAERIREAISPATIRGFSMTHGILESSLSRWCSGKSYPSIDGLVRLADASGTNLEWLSSGNGPMRRTQTTQSKE